MRNTNMFPHVFGMALQISLVARDKLLRNAERCNALPLDITKKAANEADASL